MSEITPPTVNPEATAEPVVDKPVEPNSAERDAAKLKLERDKIAQELAEYQRKEAEAKEAQEAQERDELAKTGDLDKVKEAYQSKYDRDTAALKEQNIKLQKLLVSRDRDMAVAELVAEHAMPDKERLVKLALKDRIKAELTKDGKTKITVYDEEGELTADTPKDLIAQLRKEYKDLFKAKTGRGSLSDKPPTNPEKHPAPPSFQAGKKGKLNELLNESIADKTKRHLALLGRG